MLETLGLLLAMAIAILVLGRFLFWWFPLELLTHFQVTYFWLTIALIIIYAILLKLGRFKSRLGLFILLFALAVNGFELANWHLSGDRLTKSATDSLKVMNFNVNYQNLDRDRISESITSVDPDLVLIVEMEASMMQKIKAKAVAHPYSFRSLDGGLAVFSKLPLEDSSSQKFAGSNATNLVTHLNYRNKRIQIIGTHPIVPVKTDLFARRNLHLKSLANYLKQQNQPTILMGDFNLTPWSPYYREFVNGTDLHNTRSGFGILPTWIRTSTVVNLPKILFPILNIPIDHIFISKDFKVLNTYVGDNGNSDHAPIISELIFR